MKCKKDKLNITVTYKSKTEDERRKNVTKAVINFIRSETEKAG